MIARLGLIAGGVAATSLLLSCMAYLRGVVLDDWSGASPASRLFWAPLIFAAGFVLALVVLGVGRLFKWAPIDNGARLFLFGLFFGLVGAGPFLSYWVSSAEIWALLLVAVLGLSLRYTLRHKA